jgi:hypothetical protein
MLAGGSHGLPSFPGPSAAADERPGAPAEEAAEKGRISHEKLEKHTAGAEARSDSIAFMPGINPRPTARPGLPPE